MNKIPEEKIHEIHRLYERGMSRNQIALTVGVSKTTVERHTKNIRQYEGPFKAQIPEKLKRDWDDTREQILQYIRRNESEQTTETPEGVRSGAVFQHLRGTAQRTFWFWCREKHKTVELCRRADRRHCPGESHQRRD